MGYFPSSSQVKCLQYLLLVKRNFSVLSCQQLTGQKQTTTPKQQSAKKNEPLILSFSANLGNLIKKKSFCLFDSQYSAKSQSDYYLYFLLVNTIELFLRSDENYIDFATIGFLLISCQQSRALCLLLCSNPISLKHLKGTMKGHPFQY